MLPSRLLGPALVAAACLPAQQAPDSWTEERFDGLQFRSIGPALMSGRIADLEIHPDDENTWYVGVGSGGVWKTVNAGVTFTPIFDEQPSYSIGCISLDRHNPHRVYVGTGENVGGRHIGYGDGVYRSDDGGKTWQHLGLEGSEHIGEIVVHPDDPDTLFVAAQGPLWSPGGQRGIYKTTDGGESWTRVLGDDQWIGATELVMDPRNPDRLYAATWQRHRTVAAYMGGGPGSGLHRSDDGGETWTELSEGLPEQDMGKIGLAMSPQQPDVLYAAIELERRTGGVWKSTDRGATWSKQSDTVAGATGPHYYQELYASPHAFDRIYLADSSMKVSDDGGKTFRRMGETWKHGDNHALAFKASDPDYLLCGSDGGVYESFDLANNWRFMANLPLTQFYKIALDDAEPFYNVYGGTQDNSTEGGPSRTDNLVGITNSDWTVVLDWDGHQPAVEPGNPNIVYGERQEGFLARIDMQTGEVVSIQPQPDEGEPYERFNWDAPILISPHSPTRLYFASQRIWRSDNRGNDWTPVSGDLTRNEERFSMEIMGSTQSWDSAWDVNAMSNFNTITSLAESPLQEGLLYAGTDDGLVQVSENGGESWRSIEVGSLPGVPNRAFVNDIRADLHDANTVYLCLDNHKEGDYRPYLMVSRNRGQTWQSIASNLPPTNLVWRIVQDHVDPDLLFLGTERGVFFTTDAGKRWTRLGGGMPTISVRDIHIHRRENDLVCATFGRGIYILDDLQALRSVDEQTLAAEATLFGVRDAWWYIPRSKLGFVEGIGSQGASYYAAKNPDFGAVFTYHLNDDLLSAEAARKRAEKAAKEAGRPVTFPGWDTVEREAREAEPRVWLLVRNAQGEVVRRIEGPTTKGFHRVAWDLRYPAPHAVPMEAQPLESWENGPRGHMAVPGTYTVEMFLDEGGSLRAVGEAQSFDVIPLRQGSLPAQDINESAAFWRDYEDAVRQHTAMTSAMNSMRARSKRMTEVLRNTPILVGNSIETDLRALRERLHVLDQRLNGSRAKQGPGEKTDPTIQSRLFSVELGVGSSTYGPTGTHRRQLELANAELDALRPLLRGYEEIMSDLVQRMVQAGAPWIEGERLPVGGK